MCVAATATLCAIVQAARAFTRRRRRRLRFERAAEGERAAAEILEESGYVVEDCQVTTSYPIEVDGARVEIALRADYLVTRAGDRFVAEVKTGQIAPRIRTPATRRQLLEYHVAFGVSGVLLVDAETRSVRRVAFPLSTASAPATRSRPWLWAMAAIVLVLAALVASR